ncbi:MAG: bifunctional enoyl-CoA hydratase/phosphate acetyltransferase [Clostridia bacterium]|nr:bifunctional enoyl-CoA hydratase/phosphate acetyltransferase [Clostridia bacterium]
MITDFNSLQKDLPLFDKPTLAVAAAQDAYVLSAIRSAVNKNMAKAILIGSKAEIESIAEKENISLDGIEIVDVSDKAAACAAAVSLVRQGRAQAVMKGLVDTSVFLRAVLDKENGIRKAPLLSHVGVFELPSFDRLITVTDAALNMYPNADQKQSILENAREVQNALGVSNPIAACVCAIEKFNEKMPPTVDASELVRRNREGLIKGMRIIGPLALDNALFVECAEHKGITDPLAGRADILLMPNIESGNVLYKSLAYIAGARNAGVLVGAGAPVVLTSRSDHEDTKLNSIALAMRLALYQRSHQ